MDVASGTYRTVSETSEKAADSIRGKLKSAFSSDSTVERIDVAANAHAISEVNEKTTSDMASKLKSIFNRDQEKTSSFEN